MRSTSLARSVPRPVHGWRLAGAALLLAVLTPLGGPVPPAGAQSGTTAPTAGTVTDKLRELNTANVEIRQVAFASGGGWVILHGANDATWQNLPQAAVDKIRQHYQAGNQMKLIAFTAGGGWVILFGRNGASWDGL